MNLEKINELTAQDMAGVNATILEQLNSDVQLINQLGYYIVSGGGKRIRPMIAVLAARAVGYQGSAHVTIAALIEFIHTATLLHDDVVDESDMRRGKATANAAFGNAASVLVGDFICTAWPIGTAARSRCATSTPSSDPRITSRRCAASLPASAREIRNAHELARLCRESAPILAPRMICRCRARRYRRW